MSYAYGGFITNKQVEAGSYDDGLKIGHFIY